MKIIPLLELQKPSNIYADPEPSADEVKDAALKKLADDYCKDLDKKYGNPLKIMDLDTTNEYANLVLDDIEKQHDLTAIERMKVKEFVEPYVENHWEEYFAKIEDNVRYDRYNKITHNRRTDIKYGSTSVNGDDLDFEGDDKEKKKKAKRT